MNGKWEGEKNSNHSKVIYAMEDNYRKELEYWWAKKCRLKKKDFWYSGSYWFGFHEEIIDVVCAYIRQVGSAKIIYKQILEEMDKLKQGAINGENNCTWHLDSQASNIGSNKVYSEHSFANRNVVRDFILAFM